MAQLFEDWFKDFSTWGLSRDELLQCSFTPGYDAGDVVFTSVKGTAMTRYMCNRWLGFYSAAQCDWNAARNNYGEKP